VGHAENMHYSKIYADKRCTAASNAQYHVHNRMKCAEKCRQENDCVAFNFLKTFNNVTDDHEVSECNHGNNTCSVSVTRATRKYPYLCEMFSHGFGQQFEADVNSDFYIENLD